MQTIITSRLILGHLILCLTLAAATGLDSPEDFSNLFFIHLSLKEFLLFLI